MGNLFYLELLKMKGSKMSYIFLLGGVVSPLLTFFMIMGSHHKNPNKPLYFEEIFIVTHLFIVFLVGTLFFALITIYLFNREYEEDTLKNLLTIPLARTTFILSKMFTIFVWIQFIMVSSFLTALLLGLMAGFEGLQMELLVIYVKKYLLTGLLLYMLTPINVLVTMVFKNYIPGIAINIFATLGTLILALSRYIVYCPWGIPALMTANLYEGKEQPLLSWIILIGVFLASLTASMIYFHKTDIK